MTTLWLIRHGETDWNVAGRLQGHREVPLNENGLRQARGLAATLAKEPPFAALYSSDLGRAKETAAAAAEVLGLPVTSRSELRERNFGVLSDLTWVEAEAKHPELFSRLRARDPDFVPAGGESLSQTFARTVTALNSIAREWPGAQVLVVTHGGVIDAAWRAANGVALHVKREFELHNASIHKLNWLETDHAVDGGPH